MTTDELKIKVEEFLGDKNQKVLKIEMMPIDVIKSVLESFDSEMDDDFDTNGWDHDFWIKFHGSIELQLAGSWYYGKYNLKKL